MESGEGVVINRPFLCTSELIASARNTMSVMCSGVHGQLCVLKDGSILFDADEELAMMACQPICCRRQLPHVEVSAGDLVGASLEGDSALQVWSCALEDGSPAQPKRHLQKSPLLQCESAEAAQKLVAMLRTQAAFNHHRGPSAVAGGTRRVLVIINPHSGQGMSRRNYKAAVEPILAAAGFKVVAEETRRAGHATQIVAGLAPQDFEAVVAVGGDGTVFEILQGYFQRPDWEAAVKTPIALVPSGSGNALAANCGLWSPETAAFAVVRGRARAIDIFSVLQPGGGARYHGFLSVYFGMMANLDRGTEHLRWVGNFRFTLGALYEVWRRKRYAARVAFLPAASLPAVHDARPAAKDPSPPVAKHAAPAADGWHSSTAASDSVSGDAGSLTGRLGSTQTAHQCHAGGGPQNGMPRGGDLLGELCPGGPPTPALDALGRAAELDLDSIAECHPGWQLLPAPDTAFFAAVNLPKLDFTSNTGPKAGFDTGCLDMMYVPKLASRRQGLDMLDDLEKGRHLALPFMHLEKCAALIIEPKSTGTWLMVDGEGISYERIYVEVHPRLCSVIIA